MNWSLSGSTGFEIGLFSSISPEWFTIISSAHYNKKNYDKEKTLKNKLLNQSIF